MTVQEEKQIKEYAEMYARNLVLYGVDVRDKLESATSISLALGQAYTKGRSDECERFKSAMAELQTYRSLGTVEELKEAREKQVAKKVIRQEGDCYGITKDGKEWHKILLLCPNCHRAIIRTEALDVHCMYCGQAIDWEEGGK